MANGKFLNPFEIIDVNVNVLAHISRAGIAWRNEQLVYLLALCDLPCQGMLATASS